MNAKVGLLLVVGGVLAALAVVFAKQAAPPRPTNETKSTSSDARPRGTRRGAGAEGSTRHATRPMTSSPAGSAGSGSTYRGEARSVVMLFAGGVGAGG